MISQLVSDKIILPLEQNKCVIGIMHENCPFNFMNVVNVFTIDAYKNFGRNNANTCIVIWPNYRTLENINLFLNGDYIIRKRISDYLFIYELVYD